MEKMSNINNWEATQLTNDSFLSGSIACVQNKTGYRFSVDPVLLSHFIDIKEDDTLLDLGAGCGIIQLIILFRHSEKIRQFNGIEVQKRLCGLAVQNISINKFENKAAVVEGNVKNISDYFSAETYDKIICNPPYFTPGSGRSSDNEEANIARHQIDGTLDDFLAAAAFCLKNRGAAYFIYPASLLSEIILSAKRTGLESKKLQFVYSYPDPCVQATLVLLKFLKNGRRGLEVDPPFYIYEKKNGAYSKEMQEFYAAG